MILKILLITLLLICLLFLFCCLKVSSNISNNEGCVINGSKNKQRD